MGGGQKRAPPSPLLKLHLCRAPSRKGGTPGLSPSTSQWSSKSFGAMGAIPMLPLGLWGHSPPHTHHGPPKPLPQPTCPSQPKPWGDVAVTSCPLGRLPGQWGGGTSSRGTPPCASPFFNLVPSPDSSSWGFIDLLKKKKKTTQKGTNHKSSDLSTRHPSHLPPRNPAAGARDLLWDEEDEEDAGARG